MVDSTTVLWGQTLAYTFYVLAIMAVMGWFALRVTQQGPTPVVKPGLFYAFVMSLGLKGVVGIFTPSKLETTDPVPAD
jgi:hypothetical protein